MGSARSVVLFELTKLQQRQKIMQFICCNQCLQQLALAEGDYYKDFSLNIPLSLSAAEKLKAKLLML